MRSISIYITLLFLFSVGSPSVFADVADYIWTPYQMPNGPSGGNQGPSDFMGLNCLGSDPSCVIGGTPFDIQSVALQELTSTGSGTTWKLTITENTPTNYPAGAPLPATSFGDFLIDWHSGASHSSDFYGIVLGGVCNAFNASMTCTSYTAHAGGGAALTPGGLYQADFLLNYDQMYQTPGGAAGSANAGAPLVTGGRANEPVWVSDGQTTINGVAHTNMSELAGDSPTLSVTQNSLNSVGQYANWTIVDTFSAPAGFLDAGNFAIDLSSFECANALVIGEPTAVPEPRALFLIIPAILLLGRRLRRVQAS